MRRSIQTINTPGITRAFDPVPNPEGREFGRGRKFEPDLMETRAWVFALFWELRSFLRTGFRRYEGIAHSKRASKKVSLIRLCL